MKTYHCPSPAKINWFLHVVGQLDNGYHELQTLFQFVDLEDELSFTLRNDGEIRLNGDLSDIPKEHNLIYKAAQALKPYAVDEAGIDINIVKNIPSGAGLGGGSSNAATSLLMLNQLWQLQLSQEELAKIGLSLGADVPIFILGKTAFAYGIGENFVAAEHDITHLLLAMPKDCHISTADIFQSKQLNRQSEAIDFASYSFESTHNDCQAVAVECFPSVAKTLDWLVEYAPSRMTGTGACCFAVFSSKEKAQNTANLSPSFINCKVVKTMNLSSTHQYIAEHF